METYPSFARMTMDDKPTVDRVLRREQPVISEMTFANMCIWFQTEPIQVSRFGNSLIFRGTRLSGDCIYSPPVGNDDKVPIVGALVKKCVEEGHSFLMKGIVEPLGSALVKKGYGVSSDRDNWDYVYLTADLATLPGPRFYSKRKEIKKFEANYKYEYRSIDRSIISDCIKFQEEWCRRRDCQDKPSLNEENLAAMEALHNFEELGLSGGAVTIEGDIKAFTIGEPLNSQTWVTHFEKADPEILGLYQFINKQLALQVQQRYVFVNREQDLGEPGLRAAKSSYHPHHMVEKGQLLVQ